MSKEVLFAVLEEAQRERPKLHDGDTGVAWALLGLGATGLGADRPTFGAMLGTFVLQELQRQAASRPEPLGFFHYRYRDRDDLDVAHRPPPRSRRGK